MSETRSPLWTPVQVAEYLGVSIGTLHNWRWRGIGPRASKVGRCLRYRPADVERWLDLQASEAA